MRLAALGCFENCLPLAVSSRFFLLLAAYCALLMALMAADGSYLSPVAFGPCVDGLPDLVRHF